MLLKLNKSKIKQLNLNLGRNKVRVSLIDYIKVNEPLMKIELINSFTGAKQVFANDKNYIPITRAILVKIRNMVGDSLVEVPKTWKPSIIV